LCQRYRGLALISTYPSIKTSKLIVVPKIIQQAGIKKKD
jgi:hypothetical protein